MEDNLNNIIKNSLLVNKDHLKNNLKKIMRQIKETILNNLDSINNCAQIDIKNNNGFLIDFEVLTNIFKNISKENLFYGNVTLSIKNKDVMYGKEIHDLGNVYAFYDGNPYFTLELILRNILAGNCLILINNGYMYGVNNLFITLIKTLLKEYDLEYLVQQYITSDYEEILKNDANIDLVIALGDHDFQKFIATKCQNKIILSGYENYDLYIEDLTHIDLLNKILGLNLNMQVYINKNLKYDVPNSIIVDDVIEAIAQINYNGSRYSSSIFTTSIDNASLFIKNIKSSKVVVNTSPTIDRIMDLNQRDLVNEKTIIYPFKGQI